MLIHLITPVLLIIKTYNYILQTTAILNKVHYWKDEIKILYEIRLKLFSVTNKI